MGSSDDRRFSCRKVFFQQQSGGDQFRSVVVKPIHNHIGWEIRGWVPGLRIQSQQITDCIGIFKLVQSTKHGVIANPRKLLACLGNSVGDHFNHRKSLRLTGLGLMLRWHFPQVQLVHNFLPHLLFPKIFDR